MLDTMARRGPTTKKILACWQHNQILLQLDQALRFGYRKQGSLVVHLTIEDCRLEIGLPHVLISKQNSNCFASFHSYELRLCSKKSKNKMLRYCFIMRKESCWILVL
jgi:hypothetical protein